MRALIVGLGSIGRRHARNWSALGLGPLLVYREVGGPLPEPLGVEYQPVSTFEDGLDRQPDLVVICNPTSLHVPFALRAVQRGISVLVEKPLGSSLDGVPELLQAARQNGCQVLVGYQFRLHPYLQNAKALLAQGAIGRPLTARATAGEYLPGWHPWEDYRDSYSGRADLGGGPVLTLSHDLDYLCWLLGYPTSVTAATRRVSSLEISTEDVAEIILDLPGGVLASVHLDYLRRQARRSLEIVGEDGVLRWEWEQGELALYSVATDSWQTEPPLVGFDRNDLYLSELRQVAAVLDGAPPGALADGYQGAAILAVALAARQSAHERRSVPIPVPFTP